MADADDVLESILDNATQPIRVEGDMGKVFEQPLPDQINAYRFAQAQTAATANPNSGFRFKKIVPPGGPGSAEDRR